MTDDPALKMLTEIREAMRPTEDRLAAEHIERTAIIDSSMEYLRSLQVQWAESANKIDRSIRFWGFVRLGADVLILFFLYAVWRHNWGPK